MADQISAGKLTWAKFGGTHPKPAGNTIASEMIQKLLTKAWKVNSPTAKSDHKIPKLVDALNTFPSTSFQIDFKTDEVVNPALEVISKSNASERVCVASFNSERLNNVRSTHPHLCISMGPNEVAKTLMSSFGIYRGIVPGDCLQIPIR